MRYVVVYKDEHEKIHHQHVEADSSHEAYDHMKDGYDAKHGKGAFDKLTVGVGLAADPNFRDQYEVKSGVGRRRDSQQTDD
jgi:hypothetical protein